MPSGLEGSRENRPDRDPSQHNESGRIHEPRGFSRSDRGCRRLSAVCILTLRRRTLGVDRGVRGDDNLCGSLQQRAARWDDPRLRPGRESVTFWRLGGPVRTMMARHRDLHRRHRVGED